MKKLTIAAVTLIIIIILLAVILFFPKIDGANFIGGDDGLSAGQKVSAVYLALCHMGWDTISINPSECYIGGTTYANTSDSAGYFNASGTYVQVPVQFGSGLIHQNEFIFINLSDRRVIGTESRSYRGGFPFSADVEIPPGAYWYQDLESIYMVNGKHEVMLDLNFKPGSELRPFIIYNDQLKNLKKGLPFVAIEYTDYITNETCVYDGNKSIASGWHPNISISSYTGAMIVLKNVGNSTADVSMFG